MKARFYLFSDRWGFTLVHYSLIILVFSCFELLENVFSVICLPYESWCVPKNGNQDYQRQGTALTAWSHIKRAIKSKMGGSDVRSGIVFVSERSPGVKSATCATELSYLLARSPWSTLSAKSRWPLSGRTSILLLKFAAIKKIYTLVLCGRTIPYFNFSTRSSLPSL